MNMEPQNQQTPQQQQAPSLKQELMATKGNPAQLVKLKSVEKRFKDLYKFFNQVSDSVAEAMYQQEQFNFLKAIQANTTLAGCDPISLYGCFCDAATNGLSFDPTQKLVYMIPYGQTAKLAISPYGELKRRIQSGQIKYADNPVIVFEGDLFKVKTSGGITTVEHEAVYPRESDKIIACFVCITRTDGSVDYKVLGWNEIEKLRSLSKQPNALAWTGGLFGMVQAKTLKHAFRTYPPVTIKGQFTEIAPEEETEDIPHEEIEPDYGLGDDEFTEVEEVHSEAPPFDNPQAGIKPQPLEEVKPEKPQSKQNDFGF